MKNKTAQKFLVVILGAIWSFAGTAQNPIIQTRYTADPAPMVYNSRVYLYTSHDEDSTVNNLQNGRLAELDPYKLQSEEAGRSTRPLFRVQWGRGPIVQFRLVEI